jgi:hypothetical protein
MAPADNMSFHSAEKNAQSFNWTACLTRRHLGMTVTPTSEHMRETKMDEDLHQG